MTETFTVLEFNLLVGTNRATYGEFHFAERKTDAFLQIQQNPQGPGKELTRSSGLPNHGSVTIDR